ncbi:MAG: T9SS type A sorting domain-containing protein [Vicingaceae bacterium]
MKKLFPLALILLTFLSDSVGQQTVDLSFQFPPGGSFRKYHIYIPSSYNQGSANKMMVGFHPFNTSRWDGESWRDSLITFAEFKGLLLVCPDGGTDGKLEGQVDLDFTSALMDSMLSWYNVDPYQVFGIGFSIGAKFMYEYGLKNSERFKGFIPVGAAIDDPGFVNDIISKAKCKNYFLVHGEKDNPNTRYYPIKSAIQNAGANVDGILMAGIGHTFDFQNRNQILYMAFNYIDTASCDYTALLQYHESGPKLFPNPVSDARKLIIHWPDKAIIELIIFDGFGQRAGQMRIESTSANTPLSLPNLAPGMYQFLMRSGNESYLRRIVIVNK